jgi:trehalose synthase-fused probable maltokinase
VARVASRLPALLPSQRWFRGKARTILSVHPLDHAVLPGSGGVLAFFEVAYGDGGREAYLVPVVPDGGEAGFADAMDEPAFCAELVDQIRHGGLLPGTRGRLVFIPTQIFPEILPDRPREITRLRVEQSNTSVIFDRRSILKLFRQLEPGLHPDFEITDFLTRQTDFRGTPRLLGSITYEAPGAVATSLAMLQEFVENRGDAWTTTQARLGEYYDAAVAGAGEGRGGEPAFARTLAAADAREAERLGRLTGFLHIALASAPGGHAFAPEPFKAAEVAACSAGMQAHLDRLMATLASTVETLAPPVRQLAREVLADGPRLRDGLTALQALGTEGVMKIRIHGDLHLGQVLVAGNDFMILDFEGEPARPLEERRAKQCALKDVAGMLRSFAYAAQAGLLRAVETMPEDPDLEARLSPWAQAWEDGLRHAFLEGYLTETWERGSPFLPREREALEAVLRAYELDKAIYELGYEINNRPAWVRIPLEALRRPPAVAPTPGPPGLRPGEGPFDFVACLELREFVGARAENERQLADLIEEVPLDSIYYHTHSFFLRHKFLVGAYPNDFANWAAIQVRDRVLGERLAMVDPGGFPNLAALREELVAIIDDHLRRLQIIPGVIFGEPFEFIQSRIVKIPTGVEVRTLQQFRDALLNVDVSAIYFHLVEARMRLGRGRNDFAAWLERGLCLPHLAAKVQALDPYSGSLERTRTCLIQLCDEALAAGVDR